MAEYNYTKIVNCDKLTTEIRAQSLPLSHMTTFGSDQLSVIMTRDLDLVEEKPALDSIVSTHSAVDMPAYVKNRIFAAMEFGRNITAEYGAKNVLMGRTVADVQQIIVLTAKLQSALLTGSLYVALDELSQISPDGVLILESDIVTFRHKIQDYLQIPRT